MNKLPILIIATVLTLSACSKVGAGQQAVEVDSWGSPTVSGCVKEESQVGTMTVDLYRYPARAISWDANTDSGAERGPYTAMSSAQDQAEMSIPMTITFDMTTDCNKLRQFHRDYGTKYQGWLNDDGTTSDGWKQLLNYVISQPAEQAVIGITQKHPWRKVWNDDVVRSEYKAALQAQLPKESAARTGGTEYFTNFVVSVGKPWPTDQALRDAVARQQSSQAEARARETQLTADANARQAAAEAERLAAIAQRQAEEQKALVRQAEIAGFGTGPGAIDAYLRDKCRQEPNCHQYDPSPIIAGVRP